MRIASWNINSIRIRLHLLEKLTAEEKPDIICLQEIKAQEEHFPFDAVRALGYPHVYVCGQKGYHGVAILSKIPLMDVHCIRLLESADARHIAAKLPDGTELHNFYVPAGGDIPDRVENPYYGFKLDYVAAMRDWFARERKPDARMILLGDLNIAPHEHDVWSHKQLLKVVSHTPDEVERLLDFQESMGWVDAARQFTPLDQKLYSWWSYRNKDWRASNRGRRLDHIWLTPRVADKLRTVNTLTDARDWERGSDHVPVVADLALA